MSFNTSKWKVMVLNGTRGNIALKLNNQTLQTVDRYKYLGVTFDAKHITNLFKMHFSLLLEEKAKLRVAMIWRYGFRENGLRVTSSIKFYELQVRPLLEYRAQVLVSNRYGQRSRGETQTAYAKEIENFQT